MKIAVLMDPVEQLKPAHDTTLALIAAAESAGHEVWCFSPKDWYCEGQQVLATLYQVKAGQRQRVLADQSLATFEILLMRQNPPVDSEYMYASLAMSLLEAQGVWVINRPQSVRNFNEKMAILQFPEWIVPTLVSADLQRLQQFWAVHQQVVLKPLDGMGGKSVFYIDQRAQNLPVLLEVLTQNGSRSIMAQQYIPEIHTAGDKRILMMFGEPVPYALARFPSAGEHRGNLSAGGQGTAVPLTDRDRAICAAVGPILRANGLDFVGLDVIGAYLTEVNVTSPMCLVEIASETSLAIAQDFWHRLEQAYERRGGRG